jgi:hypothetical protein
MIKRAGFWCGAFSAATALLIVAAPPHDAYGADVKNPTVTSVAVTTGAPDLLTRIKTKSARAVSERLETVKMLRDRADTAANISSAHRAALDTELDALATSLKATDAKVQAASDVATASRDAAAIVTDHRIYVLEVPKVHLLIALDDVTTAADRLQQLVANTQQGLDALQAAGVDTASGRQKLAAAQSKIDALRSSAQAQSSAVIALDPKGYPGNKPTVQAARTSLNSARDVVKSIRSDLKLVDNLSR